jgi:hypothetical protein
MNQLDILYPVRGVEGWAGSDASAIAFPGYWLKRAVWSKKRSHTTKSRFCPLIPIGFEFGTNELKP